EAEAGELRERAVVQLERRPRAGQVLDRRVTLPVHYVVQHQMSLAERPPLRVLTRQPDRRPLDDERGERQRLGVRPFDPRLSEGAAPALQLAQQLGVDTEAGRHSEQLLIEAREHLAGDGRGRLRDRLGCVGDALWLLTLSRFREM